MKNLQQRESSYEFQKIVQDIYVVFRPARVAVNRRADPSFAARAIRDDDLSPLANLCGARGASFFAEKNRLFLCSRIGRRRKSYEQFAMTRDRDRLD
jgi:hypothetical protein